MQRSAFAHPAGTAEDHYRRDLGGAGL